MSQSLQKEDFGGRRAAVLVGIRRAAGTPAIVLGASFIGFGALVHQTGLSVWHALFSTATGWAQPGQVALFELYGLGASIVVIGAAVTLTSVRLLPMAVTFMPLVRAPGTPRWLYYLAANWVAVTTWAFAMRDCPRMPAEQRLPYFMGFSCTLWGVTLVTTGIGFVLAGIVPLPVTLGLVFINPIYFMLMTAADVRSRARILAVVLGAAGGPAFYLLTPDWSLLLAGVGAGTLGFLLGGGFRRRV